MYDIIIGVAIAAAIAFIVMMMMHSAGKAHKGHAPVKTEMAPLSRKGAAGLAAEGARSPTGAAAAAGSPSGSADSKNNKTLSKKDKKKRAAEEAEEDALIEAELKKGTAGMIKEKFEVKSLDDIAEKNQRAARTKERTAEGKTFSEKQVAQEKAQGFVVVGANKDSEKERSTNTKAAKSKSPKGGNNNGNNASSDREKREKRELSRTEELDRALNSVLGRGKRGGRGGGGGGGGGGRGGGGGDREFAPRDNGNKGEGEVKGFVDMKGEVKAAQRGGAWQQAA